MDLEHVWRSRTTPLVLALVAMGAATALVMSAGRTGESQADAPPTVGQVAYDASSFGRLRFFARDGAPLLWYHRTKAGEYELFESPGRHPRYGVALLPVTADVVLDIEQALKRGATTPPPATTPAAASLATPEPTPRPTRAPPPPVATVPPAPRTRTVQIPMGTVLRVVLQEPVSSENPGRSFRAQLAEPLDAEDLEVADRGAAVSGRVVSVAADKKHVSLALSLTTVRVGESTLALDVDPVVLEVKRESGFKKALKVVGGAVAGAIVGATVGGKKGAARGSAIGAAAGTVAVVLSKDEKSIEVPADTAFAFTTAQDLAVTIEVPADSPRRAGK